MTWSLRFIKASLKLLCAPKDLRALLAVGDLISETRWYARADERARLQDRFSLSIRREKVLRRSELSDLPAGSLGREYLNFLDQNSLTMYESGGGPWLRERSRSVHDLLHVILGRGISVPDEILLNAHLAYAIGLPISTLILRGGLVRLALTSPVSFFEVRSELREIRSWSESQPCLLLAPLEDWLSEPLDVVRARLKLNRFA